MEALQKNDLFDAEIRGYSSEGEGVARVNGCVVFVKNALDGETCRIRILKAGKTAAWAKIETLLAPSPHRTAPACPAFGRCGGCALLHMDYGEELRFKRARVDDALQRIAGIGLRTESILPSPETEHYRNKAIYAVGTADGRAVTGFFRPRSHEIVPAETCLIQAAGSQRAAAAVRGWMDRYGVPAYDEGTGTGGVRHVFCRSASDGALQVTVVSAVSALPHLRELTEAIRAACPETAGLLLNVNDTRGNTVLGGVFRTLWGAPALEDTLCSLRFSLSPQSFYQVNHGQAERLYAAAAEYAGLTGGETVLDLYCGTGTITLCLARLCRRAVGAEIVPEAVADARENARRNGIANADFLCADAEEAAGRFAAAGERPDVVVVDPPRKGLAPEVIASIAAMAPERVVYVSCDPATLARDVRLFAERGYAAVRARAVDMFPRTPHVETVVLLSQQRPNDKIRVELDLTDFDITAAEKEATYQEIKDYIFEKHGMKVSSLYIAQVKEKLGIKERENYNPPKNSDSKQPQCPEEKEKMIVEALKHFKMI